jgi:hypothetical protein
MDIAHVGDPHHPELPPDGPDPGATAAQAMRAHAADRALGFGEDGTMKPDPARPGELDDANDGADFRIRMYSVQRPLFGIL